MNVFKHLSVQYNNYKKNMLSLFFFLIAGFFSLSAHAHSGHGMGSEWLHSFEHFMWLVLGVSGAVLLIWMGRQTSKKNK